jgi:hypothetical protein
MMKKLIVLVLILLIMALSACSGAETIDATPTEPPPPSDTPLPSATFTEVPTATFTPSPTLTPTPLPLNPEQILALNNPAAQERGQVNIEVVRFLIGEKDVVLSDHPDLSGEEFPTLGLTTPIFDDKEVVGEIVLRITNNQPERVITLFLSELTIAAGGQQLRLEEYILNEAYFGDDINPFNPDILPETGVLVGYWFGFKELDIAELNKVNIAIEEPYYSVGNTYYPIGSRYFMTLEFTEPVFEPVEEPAQ